MARYSDGCDYDVPADYHNIAGGMKETSTPNAGAVTVLMKVTLRAMRSLC